MASIPKSRWAAYGAAGAASALAAISSAEAEVHYSGILNQAVKGSRRAQATFPLNGSAHLSFVRFAAPGGNGITKFFIPGSHSRLGSSVGAFAGELVGETRLYLSNLRGGVNLSDLRFNNNCHATTSSGAGRACSGGTLGRSDAPNGDFTEGGKGFIGFVFDTSDGPQYGWVRVKTSGATAYHLIVVDYAWGDPGEKVRTGQKRSSKQEEPIPLKGSVGLLALGSAGLIAWRKRRSHSQV